MTQSEKLGRRIPQASEVEIADLLETAAAIINAHRYPFGEMPSEIEPRYLDLQLRICVDLYSKVGAEGEVAHGENGVSRSYSSAWVSPELLNEIVPKVGVPS